MTDIRELTIDELNEVSGGEGKCTQSTVETTSLQTIKGDKGSGNLIVGTYDITCGGSTITVPTVHWQPF